MSNLTITDRVEIVIPDIEYRIKTKDSEFYFHFLHKTNNGEIRDGITNEDLMAILTNRIEGQNRKKADKFNNKILYHLREAQRWLEDRGFFYRNLKARKQAINK